MMDAQKLLNEGMQLMQRNQPHLALPLFDKLLAAGIKDSRLYRITGAAHERLHRWHDAIRNFTLSLKQNPKQPDLLESIARIEMRLENYSSAENCYRQLLNFGAPPGVKFNLGLCLLKLVPGQFNEAETLFNEILPQKGWKAKALVGLARSAANQGNDTRQKQYLDEALAEDSNLTMALNDLAWWYNERGQYQLAIELFQRLLTLLPDHSDTLESLAIAQLDSGDIQNALNTVQRGLRKHPFDLKLTSLYASINYEMGEANFLKPYKDVPIQKMPDAMLADYINKLSLSGAHEEAEQVLAKAQKSAVNNPHLDFLKANLSYQKGDFHTSLHLLQPKYQNVDAAPQFWLEKMAVYLLACEEYCDALRYLNVLLRRIPDEQYYWGLKCTALRMLEDPEYLELCNYNNLVHTAQIEEPEGFSDIQQFNQELLVVLEEIQTMKRNPLAQSLFHGTQTTGTLFNRGHNMIRLLKQSLQTTINKMIADLPDDKSHPLLRRKKADIEFTASWSVKLGNHGFHKSHVHPKGWFSSVYYVNVPEELNNNQKQGWLHLGKPGVKLNQVVEAEKWIKPVAGELTIFPSYCWHGTEPFASKTARTTVAFDFVPK